MELSRIATFTMDASTMPGLLKEPRLDRVSRGEQRSFPGVRPSQSDLQHRKVLERELSLTHPFQLVRVSLPLAIADGAAVQIAFWLAYSAFVFAGREVSHFPLLVMASTPTFLLCCWARGLYPGLGVHPATELRRLFGASVTTLMAIGAATAFALGPLSLQCMLALWSFLLLLLLLPLLRGVAKASMRLFRIGVPFYFFGERQSVIKASREIERLGWSGLVVAGRFAPLHSNEPQDHLDFLDEAAELEFERKVPYLGTEDDLQLEAQANSVYCLCIVDGNELASQASLVAAGQFFPEVLWISTRGDSRLANSVASLGLANGVWVQEALLHPSARLQKRLLDLAIVVPGIVLLSPLFLAIGLLVKMSSRGPILFSHQRVGWWGEPIRTWKFRSMVTNAQEVLADYLAEHPELTEEWERNHKLKNDPRITWIGRFLRKSSLDELPQLWNVLMGEMSLVGPRPIVREEIAKYGGAFQDYVRVPPGITGLWQVSGRNNTTYEERLLLDGYYVRNWSPWLDIYILIRTVKTVVCCEGAY